MTWEQFRRALVMEQYAVPVAEWHSSVDDLLVAAERCQRLDDTAGAEQGVAS